MVLEAEPQIRKLAVDGRMGLKVKLETIREEEFEFVAFLIFIALIFFFLNKSL